jgi:hypothetical protein
MKRETASRLFERYMFKPVAAPIYSTQADCYFRRLRFHGDNLRAYVSQVDGEIRLLLEHEDGRPTETLRRTRDLAEVENILTKRFRPRFPRT